MAQSLNFDEKEVQTVITNLEKVKAELPRLVKKCEYYFVDIPPSKRTNDWEGLSAAQDCLPTSELKDKFGADYRALNRVWEALSPDACLQTYRYEYVWLSQVYESVRPVDNRGKLIWAALGPKTIELVHQNVTAVGIEDDLEILELDADLIEQFMKGKDPEKVARKIEIDLVARIRKHDKDKKFIELGKRLEELRERHELGLIVSVEFLKAIIELAKGARAAEIETVPEEEVDKGRAALTELFEGVRNEKTPVIVENVVNDIDEIVRNVRFDGWQATTAGVKEVKKELRKLLWMRYKLKDQELFDKAYGYIESYY